MDQRHLDQDDECCVDREQESDSIFYKAVDLAQEKGPGIEDLVEDDAQTEQEAEDDQVRTVLPGSACLLNSFFFVFSNFVAGAAEDGTEKNSRGNAGDAIHPEQVSVIHRSEETAEGRSDCDAEVDGKALQGESAGTDFRRTGPGDGRHVRRPERFGDDRLQKQRGTEGGLRSQITECDESDSRKDQTVQLDCLSADPVAQPSPEIRSDKCSQSVDADHPSGCRHREAKLAGQIKDHEKQDHRAAPVDEDDQREHPGLPRQACVRFLDMDDKLFQHDRHFHVEGRKITITERKCK